MTAQPNRQPPPGVVFKINSSPFPPSFPLFEIQVELKRKYDRNKVADL